tara:strand:- start:852 stop:1061 length:210 start_codon:yes stop_codon:yes gene_type:complete
MSRDLYPEDLINEVASKEADYLKRLHAQVVISDFIKTLRAHGYIPTYMQQAAIYALDKIEASYDMEPAQ